LALWKIRLEPFHLDFVQPIKVVHIIPPVFRELKHTAKVASGNLMGPELRARRIPRKENPIG
jgi:hypothetical protein